MNFTKEHHNKLNNCKKHAGDSTSYIALSWCMLNIFPTFSNNSRGTIGSQELIHHRQSLGGRCDGVWHDWNACNSGDFFCLESRQQENHHLHQPPDLPRSINYLSSHEINWWFVFRKSRYWIIGESSDTDGTQERERRLFYERMSLHH